MIQAAPAAPSSLRSPVGQHVRGRTPPPPEHPERDCRVVMGARDVAARVDHRHQHGPDGQRRDHARSRCEPRAADRQHKKERPDEFHGVLAHGASFRPDCRTSSTADVNEVARCRGAADDVRILGAAPVPASSPIPPSVQQAHSQGGRTLARGRPARQGRSGPGRLEETWARAGPRARPATSRIFNLLARTGPIDVWTGRQLLAGKKESGGVAAPRSSGEP